jgi:hypothetical protein
LTLPILIFLADIIGGVPQGFVTQGEISQSKDTPDPSQNHRSPCPPF